jgi:hypothetical protein
MADTDPPQIRLPHERAMEDAVGAMWQRGIGQTWLVPHPRGFAVVRPAPADAPVDELLLDETVFTSGTCDYATLEDHWTGAVRVYARHMPWWPEKCWWRFSWGADCILDVEVERQPRRIILKLYVPLEYAVAKARRNDSPDAR